MNYIKDQEVASLEKRAEKILKERKMVKFEIYAISVLFVVFIFVPVFFHFWEVLHSGLAWYWYSLIVCGIFTLAGELAAITAVFINKVWSDQTRELAGIYNRLASIYSVINRVENPILDAMTNIRSDIVDRFNPDVGFTKEFIQSLPSRLDSIREEIVNSKTVEDFPECEFDYLKSNYIEIFRSVLDIIPMMVQSMFNQPKFETYSEKSFLLKDVGDIVPKFQAAEWVD
jgi:hypothetical protein